MIRNFKSITENTKVVTEIVGIILMIIIVIVAATALHVSMGQFLTILIQLPFQW